MKKTLYYILICLTVLNADTLDDAKELEKEGKYKEANSLYKTLLKEDRITNKQVDYFEQKIDKSNDKETNFTIKQIINSNFEIYPYKDNYFLPFTYDFKKKDGRKKAEAKFQISFKKPITYNLFSLNETINIAYTQTSYWQIYKQSAPFRETNYKPEIYILFPYSKLNHTLLKAYKISLMHESNGRDNESSRSWNRIYIEGLFQISNVFLSSKVWARIPDKKDDNPNLYKYYGYGEIEISHIYRDNIYKLKLRNNLKFSKDNKGFIEFSYSFAVKKNYFAYMQISSGYAESLIDYDKEINRISIGISLSR